jgi:methylamine methyltransferase corrinoid activation protein
LSTAVTTRHPLAGANVIDHLHFALEAGLDCAHDVVINAVNRVIDNLRIERIRLSEWRFAAILFNFPFFMKLRFGIWPMPENVNWNHSGWYLLQEMLKLSRRVKFGDLDLNPEVDVIIPPAVQHEIGADALAMMIQTGMLEKDEISIVTDYGTNAEMALVLKGIVYTGSTAAGPAWRDNRSKMDCWRFREPYPMLILNPTKLVWPKAVASRINLCMES